MNQTEKSWFDEEDVGGATVSVVAEPPPMTAATIAAVAVVVLAAIGLVFLLGVLVDWRHQRLLEKQLAESKRMRRQRRVVNSHPEDEGASIAHYMEESATSTPPADLVRGGV